MKKITIPYFPAGIKYATPLLVVLGIYLWTIGYPVWTGGLALLAIFILTTNYVTVINLNKKEIKGLKEFVDFLKVDIADQTTSEHFKIDLSKY